MPAISLILPLRTVNNDLLLSLEDGDMPRKLQSGPSVAPPETKAISPARSGLQQAHLTGGEIIVCWHDAKRPFGNGLGQHGRRGRQ